MKLVSCAVRRSELSHLFITESKRQAPGEVVELTFTLVSALNKVGHESDSEGFENDYGLEGRNAHTV